MIGATYISEWTIYLLLGVVIGGDVTVVVVARGVVVVLVVVVVRGVVDVEVVVSPGATHVNTSCHHRVFFNGLSTLASKSTATKCRRRQEVDGLKSCRLFCLEYHARECVAYQTHIANIDDELKHRLVQVWAELDDRHRSSYLTVATPSQCV